MVALSLGDRSTKRPAGTLIPTNAGVSIRPAGASTWRLVGAARLQLDSLDVQDVSPTWFVIEDADKHRLGFMALEEELDHALDLVADDGVQDHSRTVVDRQKP
jgi:hypothetical protein